MPEVLHAPVTTQICPCFLDMNSCSNVNVCLICMQEVVMNDRRCHNSTQKYNRQSNDTTEQSIPIVSSRQMSECARKIYKED